MEKYIIEPCIKDTVFQSLLSKIRLNRVLPLFSYLIELNTSTAMFKKLFPPHDYILFYSTQQRILYCDGIICLREAVPKIQPLLSASPVPCIFFYPMPQDLFLYAPEKRSEWQNLKESWLNIEFDSALVSEMVQIVKALLNNQTRDVNVKHERERLQDVKMRIYYLMWISSLAHFLPIYALAKKVLFKWIRQVYSVTIQTEWDVILFLRALKIPVCYQKQSSLCEDSFYSPNNMVFKEMCKHTTILPWFPHVEIHDLLDGENNTIEIRLETRGVVHLEYRNLPSSITQARYVDKVCAFHVFTLWQDIDTELIYKNLISYLYSIGYPHLNRLIGGKLILVGPVTTLVYDKPLYMLYTSNMLFGNSKLMYQFLQNWKEYSIETSCLLIGLEERTDDFLYKTSKLIGPVPKHCILNINSILVWNQISDLGGVETTQVTTETDMPMFALATPDDGCYPPGISRPRITSSNGTVFCTFDWRDVGVLLIDRCKAKFEEIDCQFWIDHGLEQGYAKACTSVSAALTPIFQKVILSSATSPSNLASDRQVEADILAQAQDYLEATLAMNAKLTNNNQELRFRDNMSLALTIQGRWKGRWVDYYSPSSVFGPSISALLQHLGIVSSHAEAILSMKQWLDGHGGQGNGVTSVSVFDTEATLAQERITLERVANLWARSIPLSHASAHAARMYLHEHRGFKDAPPWLIEDNLNLRFSVLEYRLNGQVVTRLPTLVTSGCAEDRRLIMVQRIYLDANTKKKTDIGDAKKYYGKRKIGGFGGQPRVESFFCANKGTNASNRVVIAEGVEDALTIAWALPTDGVYAVLGKQNFIHFCFHPGAKLYICLDNDSTESVEAIKDVIFRRKNPLKQLYPNVFTFSCCADCKDYNDMLQARGIDAVRADITCKIK